ncbi:LAME_0A01134g1_1 [Lachancea meyersii CBS 8951]|uniref:LAME_0A01134g1_1 n=1 Tax=Lachancea meyersii CBS 8951 TaxID=1266667 RepID=A0A1G4ILJ4_9SACH|nr:LAME_0A01134g1_1 [Lachancea meyersii CBS 8951]
MGAETPQSLQSQSSGDLKDSLSDTSYSSSASSPRVQHVIEEASSLVAKLKSCDRVSPSNNKTDDDDSIVCSRSELIQSLEKLNQMLTSSHEEVKGFKFKNMMLTASLKDSNSRFEVESQLQKQQSGRIRCQLVMQNQQLHDKLRLQDLKVVKYKKTIKEKNIEINRLTRLLNNSGAPNAASLKHTPQSITKPPRIHRGSKFQHKNPNMLTTLGLLASHVLSERKDSVANIDNTESDISHDSFLNHHASADAFPRSPHVLSIATLPRSSAASLTPTSDSSSKHILPRFQSFTAFSDDQQ